MEKMDIHIRSGEEYIKLGQALKLAGLVGSGVEAKLVIAEGEVLVNGAEEVRRGRKLYPGDAVAFQDVEISICSSEETYT